MFGRSQSGPGGLSINTGSANSLSVPSDASKTQASPLFQTQQQGKPAGGLFGSSTNTSQPQNNTSLFNTTTTQPQQTSGFGNPLTNQGGGQLGLLGTNSQQQQSGAQSGGQFPQIQGGGLFGSQANQQSNQPQSGGLFGSQLNNTQGSSLFGSSNIQQPQQRGGLFSLGQNQNQNQAQQSQASNTMGASTGQSKYEALFGSSTTQNRQNPFGTTQTQQQPPPTIFPGSIGQYTQQQQTIPGVRISLNELRSTTRFNDLHEELQKVIEGVDNFIQGQIHFQEQCELANKAIDNACASIPDDVEYCTKSLETLHQALENDASSIGYAKALTKTDAANAKISFKAVQTLKMPLSFHHSGLWNVSAVSQALAPSFSDEDADGSSNIDLVSYFSKQAQSMSKTLDEYKNRITEVEVYLKGIEASTMQQMHQMMFIRNRDGGERSAEDQVRELAAVLREFENGILGVAGKVGGARENVLEVMLGDYGNPNGRTARYGTL